MKITKRQLKRIIKEEKRKMLREGLTQEENLADAITEYVNALADQLEEDPLDLKPDVMGQVEAWFEGEAEETPKRYGPSGVRGDIFTREDR